MITQWEFVSMGKGWAIRNVTSNSHYLVAKSATMDFGDPVVQGEYPITWQLCAMPNPDVPEETVYRSVTWLPPRKDSRIEPYLCAGSPGQSLDRFGV